MSIQFQPSPICTTVYGPVLSRRHGISLGINLGAPEQKTCTWGCISCQCGFGKRQDHTDRLGLPSVQTVISQVEASLKTLSKVDSVTLAGNSEPSAHPDFLEIVRALIDLRTTSRGNWILNCLSNGSEIDRPDVRLAYDLLDEAWIKLDCATDALFTRLNRPIARVGSYAEHLSRIKKLNRIHIQTVLWCCEQNPTLANWTAENRKELIKALNFLKPNRVHVTTVARSPAIKTLRPVPSRELQAFGKTLVRHGHLAEVFC